MKKFFRHGLRPDFEILSSRGVSMMEALVAIGVISIIAFAFLSWSSMYYRGASSVAENNEITDTMAVLMAAFGDDDRYCRGMLGGTPLAPSDTDGASIDAVYFVDLLGNKKEKIIDKGEVVNPKTSVTVKDIRLKPLVQLSPSTLVSELEVTFEKVAGGPGEISRSIPLHTTIDSAGKIVKCSISPANSVVVNEKLCEVKYSGYALYPPLSDDSSPPNPDTGDHCQDRMGVKWCKGAGATSLSCSSCYPGSRVAASPLNERASYYACSASTGSHVVLPPRSYYTIGTLSNNRDPKRMALDVPTSTCLYTFMAGVDISDYEIGIKCVQ